MRDYFSSNVKGSSVVEPDVADSQTGRQAYIDPFAKYSEHVQRHQQEKDMISSQQAIREKEYLHGHAEQVLLNQQSHRDQLLVKIMQVWL
jgi:hypothetical protein